MAIAINTAEFVHKPTVGSAAADDSHPQDCRVCFEKFEEGDRLRMLPCMHKYHTACIDQWFRNGHTCPVCKYSVIQDLMEVEQDGEAVVWPAGLVTPLTNGVRAALA